MLANCSAASAYGAESTGAGNACAASLGLVATQTPQSHATAEDAFVTELECNVVALFVPSIPLEAFEELAEAEPQRIVLLPSMRSANNASNALHPKQKTAVIAVKRRNDEWQKASIAS